MDKKFQDQTVSRSRSKTQKIVEADLNADLMALTGDLAGRRYAIGPQALIGRDREAKVHVPTDDVSRRHAMIWQTAAGEYVVEDLKSRNGTLVNGVPVEVHVLKFGDKIQIGSRHLFVFTHHQALEEQLVQWQRLELIAQMTAGLVHDFNNYMAALLGYIQYLQEFVTRDTSKDEILKLLGNCLPVMESAAREGSNLARRVLSFARSGKAHQALLDLRPVIQEAVELLKRNLGTLITIDVKLPSELRVIGERTELLQVVINLFLNARDAMPDGGKLFVEGTVCHVEDEQALALQANEQVMLRVRDTGVGMDEETRKRIFEPLFTTKAHGKGTGLGLSMVSRIVESHGGIVRVDSGPGQGTEFRIFLPVAEARSTPLKVSTTLVRKLQGKSTGEIEEGAGLMLVMEPEERMRQRVARVLCSRGYEVLFATNPEELVELFEKYHPRIRLTMVNIDDAEIDTAEIRQRLRAINPATRMLFTSSQDQLKHAPDEALNVVLMPSDTRNFQEVIAKELDVRPKTPV